MIDFNGKKRNLIVASNRLPFSRYKEKDGKLIWEKATGGLITAMDPILQDTNGIWVGWDGIISDDIKEREFALLNTKDIWPAEQSREKSYRIGCVPLTVEEFEDYYNRFSNGTLWSLFHYFFEKSFIDYKCWNTYCRVNERFAEYISKISSKDDIVWIQDFHLFMTPYYLRKIMPKQEIHFFLHIPFPHIDIFSILPWQENILESLLCCNSIGFHHRRFMRNFASAVNIYKKEKKKSGKKTIEEKTTTHIYANPISINFALIDKVSKSEEVQRRVREIRAETACPKRIIAVDRIDYSKGIKQRLLGMEALLRDHPELKEEFFYYQLVVPSREDIGAYQKLKKEIDEIIGRINGEYSTGLWSPIYYNYGKVEFKELIALYLASDVGLVTPLRDGMNLVCKEYVAAHSDNDGVLVLSKFAGAIAEIKDCLSVNPYSIEDVANAVYRALNMSARERKNRMTKMRGSIRANTIKTWLDNCLRNFAISEFDNQRGGSKAEVYEAFE
jgi:alpha,alpha-trehalose-phosphate synthase [UDP-forming]